jgi:hypothetical protein
MKRNWILGGLGLVVLAVAGRLLPHAANVTPLYAVALFACAVFPRVWAVAIPLVAMIASDLLIGMHGGVWYTWTGMFAFAALGYGMRGRMATGRVMASSLAGSVVFYLWTNFGVWLGSSMYPQNAAGLLASYAAALPFFRNSLLGDLAFSGALFAAYEWYRIRRAARAATVPA